MTSPAAMLRDAAARHDWNACVAALESLASNLDPARALTLTWSVLMERWRDASQDAATRASLTDTIAALEPAVHAVASASPPAAAEVELAAPGANNFVRALEHVAEAIVARDAAPSRVASCVAAAVAECIMSTTVARWGALHPEGWARWYLAATGEAEMPPEVLLFLHDMMQDEAMREGIRAHWFAAATRFEAPTPP